MDVYVLLILRRLCNMDEKTREIIMGYFKDFLIEYNQKQSEQIWINQSELFKEFWKNKIMSDKTERLTEEEMIPIIQILDVKGLRRNDKERSVEGVAFTNIFQPNWYQVFRDIQSNKEIKTLLDMLFSTRSEKEQIDILNKIKEKSDIKNLTGENGVILNAFLFANDPQNNITMVSLEDRFLTINFFNLGNTDEIINYGYGEKIIGTRNLILKLRNDFGFDVDNRGLSRFLYYEPVKKLWKQKIGVERTKKSNFRGTVEPQNIKFSRKDCSFLNNYIKSPSWRTVSSEDRRYYKDLRDRLHTLAMNIATGYSGKIAMDGFASRADLNGRAAKDLWCCVFPKINLSEKIKLHKSFSLQCALIISSIGAELCFCLGSATTSNEKIKKLNEEYFNNLKEKLRKNLRELVTEVQPKIGPEYKYQKKWRQRESSFNNFADWLIFATSSEGAGASISTYLTPDEVEELGNGVIEKFRSMIDIFQPVFDKYTSFEPIEILPMDTISSYKKITTESNDEMSWKEWAVKLNYNIADKKFEIKSLYFEREEKKSIENMITTALRNRKHLILIGPPGSGKSKLAKEICKYYCGTDNYTMHTASADWSTFDTIGGYRPNKDKDLKFFPGIFLQALKEGKNPINRWLIIDEINRADIDKAFGSLFSALTGDDITLPFESEENKCIKIIGSPKDADLIEDNIFIIHPQWRIIATMNWFDKSSLYEMSYAFMRRFAFIPIHVPKTINAELINKYLEKWEGLIPDEVISKNLARLWEKINEQREIGPAIIEDMYRYLKDQHDDYVGTLILYVLPQFEGLPKDKLDIFYKAVKNLEFVKDTDKKRLKSFIEGFFETEIVP